MANAKKNGLLFGFVFLTDLVLFLVSVFCMYVSATTQRFYRTDIVAAEFFLALFFGAVLVVMIGRFVFSHSDAGRGDNK